MKLYLYKLLLLGILIYSSEKAMAQENIWIPDNNDISTESTNNVGIGITNPDEKLTIDGKIHTRELKITTSTPAPDYVFNDSYYLITLAEIEKYIHQHNHLPNIPSAKEIEENGLNLSEMSFLLLQKAEELTLHIINNSERLDSLQEIISKETINNKIK